MAIRVERYDEYSMPQPHHWGWCADAPKKGDGTMITTRIWMVIEGASHLTYCEPCLREKGLVW